MVAKEKTVATKKAAVKPTKASAPEKVIAPVKETEDELSVFPAVNKVDADVTTKFDAEAKDLFEKHERINALHFAADGLAFYEHTDARNHANTLTDKTVVTKVRK
jgi:hypothetical protein